MVMWLGKVHQLITNEEGAEIVEWVLWVGGIAIIAGVVYNTVSVALSNTVNTIMHGMGPISSS